MVVAFSELSQEAWLWIFTASLCFGAYNAFFTGSPVRLRDVLEAERFGMVLPDDLKHAQKILANTMTRELFWRKTCSVFFGTILIVSAGCFGILHQSIWLGIAAGYVILLGTLALCFAGVSVYYFTRYRVLNRSPF